MKRLKFNIDKILIAFTLILLILFPNFHFQINNSLAETAYSNVLTDLQKDESFNVSDYPVVEKDYSLEVIQVAESENKELLVYVYQPSGKRMDVTTIRMSLEPSNVIDKTYQDYELTYLNNEGTLFKYKVDNLVVGDDIVRYYEVIAIHRKFIKYIDEETDDNNTISEVTFEVGKLWTLATFDNDIFYKMEDIEVIKVTSKYVGMVRYFSGITIFIHNCDSHYIAFSTDKQMDYIMEADVSYSYQRYSAHRYFTAEIFRDYIDVEPVQTTACLKDTDEAENNQIGLFGDLHKWNRIQTVSEFISENADLTEEAKLNLQDKQWVLRFVETDFTISAMNKGADTIQGTEISSVSILRLKFESKGKVYNLGVVDNKQTGSGVPDNNQRNWLLELIIAIVTFVIVVILLLSFFPSFFVGLINLLFHVVVWIFKGIWLLISWPFKLMNKK